MDNLGFQQDVEDVSRSVSKNLKNGDLHHGFGNSQLLSYSNGCNDRTREVSTQPKKSISITISPKLSSSSFSLPKDRSASEYRRFSESLSCTSRGPPCTGKVLNIPSRESVTHDATKCSSFIISGNNNVIRVPDSTIRWPQHRYEDGSYIEVHCNSSNPLWSDEYQPNNRRICSSQNFQGHKSVSSFFNNVHESSNYTSVPSLSLNNSYHEGYPSSMPSFSKTSLSLSSSSSSSNKHNLISETSLDIHKTSALSPKYTNKYINLVSTQASLKNAQGSRNPSPCLMKKHQFSKDDADFNSLPSILKSQNNVNHILNHATTLPTVTIRNVRNGNQEFASGISTASGAVPSYFAGFVNWQQPSPSPCGENRQNMRRSSSVLSGGWETTLKKRTILRGWKLQFIPSDYSYRRTIAVCSVLLLACILVLVTTGLVIYMTTGQQIFSFPFSFKLYSCSF